MDVCLCMCRTKQQWIRDVKTGLNQFAHISAYRSIGRWARWAFIEMSICLILNAKKGTTEYCAIMMVCLCVWSNYELGLTYCEEVNYYSISTSSHAAAIVKLNRFLFKAFYIKLGKFIFKWLFKLRGYCI